MMSAEEVSKNSGLIISRFTDTGQYKNNKLFHLYYPINNEVDTVPLIRRIWRDGKRIMMPMTDFSRGVLTNYYVESLEALEETRFSMMEPDPDKCSKALVSPEIIIVPGVAFSSKMGRLGYGGGFYDRYLFDAGVEKVALSYCIQLRETLPLEEHDVLMDMVITETETYYKS